jgi:hypothetical protein
MGEGPQGREDTPEPPDPPAQAGRQGEDHREGPPGYDFDEQAEIERLRRERAESTGEGDADES